MNLFFTASYFGKAQYQQHYSEVLAEIEKHPVKVISPEKGNYQTLIHPGEAILQQSAKQIHYEAIKRGIMWADAVIMEVSHEDFQLGHEMTLAIQMKKPTLCLSVHENLERKIFSKYFHAARYSHSTLPDIITDFMKIATKEQLPNRFNFFISHSQLQFLQKVSRELGITSSEYLRRLIDAER